MLDWDGEIVSGKFDLKLGRFDGGGVRYMKFRAALIDLLGKYPVELVAYEGVRRHLGTDAAHVYGGLQAILTEECERRGMPYMSVSVQAIKKFATGKGNANKDAMIAAANDRWPSLKFGPSDHDEVDARWISLVARELLQPGVDTTELT